MLSDNAKQLLLWFSKPCQEQYVTARPEPEWDELIWAGYAGIYNTEQPLHRTGYRVFMLTPQGQLYLEALMLDLGCLI